MRLHRRLQNFLRHDRAVRTRTPEPIRARHALRARIGILEPRIVLNATAELNALGQLVISGDDAVDNVQLEVNASDQLLIRDGAGNVIPITNHPGTSTDPLSLSAISSNQLIVDLGGGDDVLQLEIPSSLNVVVANGAGIDSTTLLFRSSATPPTSRTIDIVSEQIRLDEGNGSIDLRGTELNLFGSVNVGVSGAVSSLQLADSSLSIDGALTIDGGINFNGTMSTIDLSNATLSASGVENDLTFFLDSPSDLLVADANDSGGARINDLTIDSIRSISIQSTEFEIAGKLTARNVFGDVLLSGDIEAQSLLIESQGNITTFGSVAATDGDIRLTSNSMIAIAGRLDSSASTSGIVALEANSLVLRDVQATTAGGDISLTGSVLVGGELNLNTAANPKFLDTGRILIDGSIDSLVAGHGVLNFSALSNLQNSSIVIAGSIGESARLRSATFRTSSLMIDSVRLDEGDLRIEALGTFANGTLSVIGGTVDVNSTFVLGNPDLEVDARRVVFHDAVIGVTGNESLRITATETVEFKDLVSQLTDLTVTADNSVAFDRSVTLSGDLVVTGASPTLVSSSTIQTVGVQQFIGGVRFLRNGITSASEVSLGEQTTVEDNVLYRVSSPVVGNTLRKVGSGTLVFENEVRIADEVRIESGALRLNGTVTEPAAIVRVIGGRLEGSGVVSGSVNVQNGAAIDPGPPTDSLTVGQLILSDAAKLKFQLDGIIAGSQHDQIIVNNARGSGAVDLGMAQLELTFDQVATPGAEYVLIRNDDADAVTGVLRVNFDTSGATSQTFRTLTEGSLVLENFGGSGRPAYITYAGGDGNDVAIVTAGDVNIEAGDVTLIQRKGSNLEIRTGTDLPSTQLSTPVIRAIAAINDYEVNVIGSPTDQRLFVDLNDFVNTGLGAIQYTGEIFFGGGGNGDNDSITLVDLDPDSDDSLDELRYSVEFSTSGNISVTTRQNASQFNVKFAQVESVKQSVAAPVVEFQFSGFTEQILVTQDPVSAECTEVTSSTSNGDPMRISIANPSRSLSLAGGDGDDSIVVQGFGTGGGGFAGELRVDGQTGDDSIEIKSDLNLGRNEVRGDLNLRAESISITGNIDTSGGDADGQVDLQGGRSIEITGGSRIDSGTAAIVVDAAGGQFSSAGGTLSSANLSDAMSVRNASFVQFGNTNANEGRVSIETSVLTGPVFQTIGTRIQTDRLVIDSIGSIDLSNSGNDFAIIESLKSRGSIELTDSLADLEIRSIDSRGSDVTIDAVGVIELSAGAIIATSATLSLTAGNAIIDNRSPVENQAPNLVAGVIQLRANGAGIGDVVKPVVVEAADAINVDTSASNGGVFLASPMIELPIGIINAAAGLVSLTALSIQDATFDVASDIISGRLTMSAQTGIGNRAGLELRDSTELTASTITGGIRLDHASSENLLLRSLVAGSGPIEFGHNGSDLLSIGKVSSGDGNISITHQDGSIEVVGEANSPVAISTGANGLVSVTAIGDESDIAVRSEVQSDLGSVRLSAGRNLQLDADGDVGTVAGNVTLIADARAGSFGGGITMADGATIATQDGLVSLMADGDIVLGGISTASGSGDAVFIQSFSSRVIDGGDTDVDLSANFGGVTVLAQTGIGNDDAIDTSVNRMVARVDNTGSIRINETDHIELKSLSTADGQIEVEASGMIVATRLESENRMSRDDMPASSDASRDILLVTSGEKSDILVGMIRANGGADVSLIADDDVIDINPSDSDRIIADDLLVRAFNGSADSTTAIQLTTEVNDLQFSVGGIHAGDAIVTEVDSINLASSDVNSDSEELSTSNGRIVIEAGGAIVVRDELSSDDGNDRRDDVEVMARGERGQVAFRSSRSIELAGATQVETSLSSAESVLLDAPSIILGPLLQIHTGNGNGIARLFSLRPQPGLTDTAFFDYTTVSTNRLTQSGANDAFGDLSLLVGTPGEQGFTINIDWGDSNDPSYRFQQIDNLPGDQLFVQRHIYREQDILNSTLNERTSATAPLEVRFAIRHHESIVVRGDTIQQAGAPEELVEGRLISSTDNPLTSPLLENGRASFAIPNLTIPMAFVPVREIIPEPIEPEIFVRVESSQFVISGNVESQTKSASSSNSRDEFLQIRVLSLEPGGEDLIEPKRLPDDILAGENLKRFFDQLPDGRYEIQYVLGDGNERMLLRFDLRDHQPIVPGDALEGDQLKLKPIDIDAVLRELDDNLKEQNLPRKTQDRGDRSMEHEGYRADEPRNNEGSVLAMGLVATGIVSRRRKLIAESTNTFNEWSYAGRFTRRSSKPR